jgi:hypothetical protein
MIRFFNLFLFVSFASSLSAQFAIGHTTITFQDPTRNNRSIATDIYYPADVAGTQTPVATGQFPVVNFGHGFVMTVSAYQHFWETLVPQGFIVCLPQTEGSFAPSHTDFAKDLAFLCTAMEAEKVKPGGLFDGHILSRYGILGHSMGGGCTVLSYQYNPGLIQCIGTFAPANTNPSALLVAPAVAVPSMTFAGSYDCIAPAAQQALLIYQALDTAACKYYVNITGASHCQFGDANTNCSLGETLSGCGNPPIAAAAQQALVHRLILPWLRTHLKQETGLLPALVDSLAGQNGFVSLVQCSTTTGTAEAHRSRFELKLVQNPIVGDVLEIRAGLNDLPIDVSIYDVSGRLWMYRNGLNPDQGGALLLPVGDLDRGVYILVAAVKSGEKAAVRFVKM